MYDDKKAAGERLLLARQEMPNADMMLLGTYRGFELNIRFDSFKNEHQAVLRAELSYPVSLGDDARGNITRLDNAIDNFTRPYCRRRKCSAKSGAAETGCRG